MQRSSPHQPTGNHLLDRLPEGEINPLIAASTLVAFAARDEVNGLLWDHNPVYFPLSGVYSLLLPMDGDDPVEVGVVDSEGMLGIPTVLGMPHNPVRAITHVPGTCLRVPADAFLAVMRANGMLEDLVRRFLAVCWQTANQTIACALRHTVKQRVCRWLLAVHDRASGNELEVTQEVLAGMVGSSRQRVTGAAVELQDAGLIRYHRGKLQVTDRGGLEAASCECYRTYRNALRFLTDPAVPAQP